MHGKQGRGRERKGKKEGEMKRRNPNQTTSLAIRSCATPSCLTASLRLSLENNQLPPFHIEHTNDIEQFVYWLLTTAWIVRYIGYTADRRSDSLAREVDVGGGFLDNLSTAVCH